MRLALPALVAAALLAAGCGGGQNTAATTSTPSTTETTTNAGTPKTIPLELFFLADDGKLVAVQRQVAATEAIGAAALHELGDSVLGTTTQVSAGLTLSISNGDATVKPEPHGAELAQIVYTLTQFPTVKTVNGKTRQDVEDFVPAILVEHPTPNEEVTSPLRVTGNANTFEATFEYELKDAAGTVLKHDFETATSGSGTRGTFDFTIPFQIDRARDGTLVVYESSAENGSRIHIREIPLRLAP